MPTPRAHARAAGELQPPSVSRRTVDRGARSVPRLSSRRSLESTRTPHNTDRSLRSVRLQVQDDESTAADSHRCAEDVGTAEQTEAVSARRQLQLLAARSVGVFVARRAASIVSNLRGQSDGRGASSDSTAGGSEDTGAAQPSFTRRAQQCVVDLMDAVASKALQAVDGIRCMLDADSAQLPVNMLLADVVCGMRTGELPCEAVASPNKYVESVLRLCGTIAKVVDKWKVGRSTSGGADSLRHPISISSNLHGIGSVLPGGTADVSSPAPTAFGSHARETGRDRVLLRLARALKSLAYAHTLDGEEAWHRLVLLCEYATMFPERRHQALQLTLDTLLHLASRTFTGSGGFDFRLHHGSVELVNWLLASFSALSGAGHALVMCSEPEARLGDRSAEKSLDAYLITDNTAIRWIASYCSWALGAGAFQSAHLHAGRVQTQAVEHIVLWERLWQQRDTHSGPRHIKASEIQGSELVTVLPALFQSVLVRAHSLFAVAPGFLGVTPQTTDCARSTRVLQLIAATLTSETAQKLPSDQVPDHSSTIAVHCVFAVFLRAYFNRVATPEMTRLCCHALEVAILLLESDRLHASEQMKVLRVVDTLLGELSLEHSSQLSKPVFRIVDSAAMHTGQDEMESRDSWSALSDSFESFSQSELDESYSDSEGLVAPPIGRPSTMPSLQLPQSFVSPATGAAPDAPTDVPASATADSGSVAHCNPCAGRRLYHDDELHILVLQLLFGLLLTTDGSLSPTYWSRTPAAEGKPNLHSLLYEHLNHDRNRRLVPELTKRLLGSAFAEGGAVLLQLLCQEMFDSSLYGDRTRLASGAHATVYRCTLAACGASGSDIVALKVIDRSSSANHFSPLPDVFSEVRVLSRLRGCEGACQLVDYGVGPDSYYIALKCYTTSLRRWRLHQNAPTAALSKDNQMVLFLRIFRQILGTIDRLSARSIIHFDIKCDNVLMSPGPGTTETVFWDPTERGVRYEVVLADFGVGKIVKDGEGMHTIRDRGTECIKSPEMILADRFASA